MSLGDLRCSCFARDRATPGDAGAKRDRLVDIRHPVQVGRDRRWRASAPLMSPSAWSVSRPVWRDCSRSRSLMRRRHACSRQRARWAKTGASSPALAHDHQLVRTRPLRERAPSDLSRDAAFPAEHWRWRWATGPAVVALPMFLIGTAIRTRSEDALLERSFGEAFRDYREVDRLRLFPGFFEAQAASPVLSLVA